MITYIFIKNLHVSLDGRGVWRRMDACICMAESLHCSSEAITVLLISCTPIVNKKFKFKQKNLHVIIKHSYEKNFFQVRKAPFGLKLCCDF